MKLSFVKAILIIVIPSFLFSCAGTYKNISPEYISYDSHDLKDGIGFSYKYDVLNLNGNKKYAKKEQKRGVKVVAVKITNYTSSSINVARDLSFYLGSNQISPLDSKTVKQELKQNTPAYLLYMLLTPMVFQKSDESGTETTHIGYVVGPAITFLNIIVASTANNNFLQELIKYDITNSEIAPNETKYGIIGISDQGYNIISLKKKP